MDSDDEQRGPVEVTFRDLTPENEPELRRLNSVVFPIRYSVRPPSLTPAPSAQGNKRTTHRDAHLRHPAATLSAG